MEPHRSKLGVIFLFFVIVLSFLAAFNFDVNAATKFVVDGLMQIYNDIKR
jgi:hypothetical protein